MSRIGFMAAAVLVWAAASGCAKGDTTSTSSSSSGSGAGGSGGTGGAAPVCGDGMVEMGEDCDDGNTAAGDGCSPTCAPETGYSCTGSPSVCTAGCGDGFLGGSEECDDGNAAAGDGCSIDCKVESGFSCKGVPSKCATLCGDGVVAGAEECDDQNTAAADGCGPTCAVEHGFVCAGAPSKCDTVCGDGIMAGHEECDDHNTATKDGCDASCQIENGYTCGGEPTVCTSDCGDGLVANDEECDDGGNAGGDGCDALCKKEPGWACAGEPSKCSADCGDGKKLGVEECDDGNLTPGDGCDANCAAEFGYTCTGSPSVCVVPCGDGLTAGAEVCDDGNTVSGDGCDASCKLEPGYFCTGEPSVCAAVCGDGLTVGPEKCDDHNLVSGDGCSAACAIETGFICTGSPSVCATVCGDGVVGGAETCDDGNAVSGDGCSSTCKLEPGWTCSGVPTVCSSICGDGILVAGEQCDDGNQIAGDCCSNSCEVEPGCEIEPNNTPALANDFASIAVGGVVKALVTPATDVDYFAVVIPPGATNGSITAATLDGVLTGDTCSSNQPDTFITISDANNVSLGTDDDSGPGLCSLLTRSSLGPGTYYVAVKNGAASTKTYSYQLQVTTSFAVCGDGNPVKGKQCEDGNTVSGDGCSATCTAEGVPQEVEPNNTFANADARAADPAPVLLNQSTLLQGAISTATDKDIFKVQLAQSGVVRFETFDFLKPNDCLGTATRIRIFSAAQVQLYTDTTHGIGSCSADAVFLNAGTYYVQVEPATAGTLIPWYFLEMRLEANAGSENEPNSSPAQADALPGVDTYIFGGHQTGTDDDYFAITVPAGKSVRAEIIEGSTAETCESDGIDSQLTLYDASALQLANQDDNGRGFCSLIDGTGSSPANAGAHNLAAGAYYIKVSATNFPFDPADTEFDYRLVVTIR
jgi:cysteine-rich repeat protein